ncbi:unnamed protein product [Owenia fusiformis]|uniref:Uncharacterized protein n=1 Tax=Owenia fusiformis TaxID=6347 RepID=A0A8J1US84_OWEFU|nr:unnamed protein product [Owenia fusiformis]
MDKFVVLVALVSVISWFLQGTEKSVLELPFAEIDTDDMTVSLIPKNGQNENFAGTFKIGAQLHGQPKLLDSASDELVLNLEWTNQALLEIAYGEIFDKGARCYNFKWEILDPRLQIHDCYDIGQSHWYGGGELFDQHWTIEDHAMDMDLYVSSDIISHHKYGSVMERYWLSSNGFAISVDQDSPLRFGINKTEICFSAQYEETRFVNRNNENAKLSYSVCTAGNIKQTHLFMSNMLFKKPDGIPDERMFKSPIWSTWARYKMFINETSLLKFAQEIIDHGFSNSQIEIDDIYTPTYGDFTFDTRKFPNYKKVMDKLHEMGFRITSWIVPFSNIDSDAFQEGVKNDYFLLDDTGNAPGLSHWWQGIGGALDVTNPSAQQWWMNNLMKLKSQGVDSFKFDAGEVVWLPPRFKSNIPLSNPNMYTKYYAELCSKFGGMIEVRVGYQSQNLPIFIRIMDKDSVWGYNNGLKSLIPSSLLFGILGYPFVLPDMIGGNAYDENNQDFATFSDIFGTKPDRELFIRWTQANTFLPSMQFSIAPWDYDDETTKICLNMVKIHEEVATPIILKYANEATQNGAPIIRPLWWVDPMDFNTHGIDSQFLVGNEILVAPILEKGSTTRDIYIPRGKWKDILRGDIITGPTNIKNYEVKLAELPYFIAA